MNRQNLEAKQSKYQKDSAIVKSQVNQQKLQKKGTLQSWFKRSSHGDSVESDE
jgi:hypothetical protein